jgi:hypothetical protein
LGGVPSTLVDMSRYCNQRPTWELVVGVSYFTANFVNLVLYLVWKDETCDNARTIHAVTITSTCAHYVTMIAWRVAQSPKYLKHGLYFFASGFMMTAFAALAIVGMTVFRQFRSYEPCWHLHNLAVVNMVIDIVAGLAWFLIMGCLSHNVYFGNDLSVLGSLSVHPPPLPPIGHLDDLSSAHSSTTVTMPIGPTEESEVRIYAPVNSMVELSLSSSSRIDEQAAETNVNV